MRPGRFDRIIYMPLPDYSGRKQIFNKYLSKAPRLGDDKAGRDSQGDGEVLRAPT
jgi:SpoVK/Ycf46/Vps4 family AAA+-type ATPase